MNKIIIGRKDKVDFPELGLINIDVKIDSGAFTSSMHCHNIALATVGDKKVLKFNLLDPSHKKYNEKEYTFARFRQKLVKSSNGMVEERFLIKTNILLFGTLSPIELTLTERGDMKYPVLIGRKLLTGAYLVDPSAVNLSYKQKKSLKLK